MPDIKLKTLDKGISYTISLARGTSPTTSLQLIREEDARKMDLRSDAAVVILRDDFQKALFTEIVQDICRRFPIASELNTGARLAQAPTATGIVELEKSRRKE